MSRSLYNNVKLKTGLERCIVLLWSLLDSQVYSYQTVGRSEVEVKDSAGGWTGFASPDTHFLCLALAAVKFFCHFLTSDWFVPVKWLFKHNYRQIPNSCCSGTIQLTDEMLIEERWKAPLKSAQTGGVGSIAVSSVSRSATALILQYCHKRFSMNLL